MNIIKAILLIPCLCVAAAAQPYEGPDTLWTRVHLFPDHNHMKEAVKNLTVLQVVEESIGELSTY